MKLHININQHQMTCRAQKAEHLHLYFLSYFPWNFVHHKIISAWWLKNCSSYLHETSYKYQSALDDVQSIRTITLACILFKLFPLNFVRHKIVSALKLENCSSFLHETSYKYQSILDDMQSARTITLDFILFELYPLEFCPSQNVSTLTWKPFKLSSRNFIKISVNIRWGAECKNHNACFIHFELFSLELCLSQNHVCSITWKLFKVSSRNFM